MDWKTTQQRDYLILPKVAERFVLFRERTVHHLDPYLLTTLFPLLFRSDVVVVPTTMSDDDDVTFRRCRRVKLIWKMMLIDYLILRKIAQRTFLFRGRTLCLLDGTFRYRISHIGDRHQEAFLR